MREWQISVRLDTEQQHRPGDCQNLANETANGHPYEDIPKYATERRTSSEAAKSNVLRTAWWESVSQDTQSSRRHCSSSQTLEASHNVEANFVRDKGRYDRSDCEEDRSPNENEAPSIYIC